VSSVIDDPFFGSRNLILITWDWITYDLYLQRIDSKVFNLNKDRK